MLRVYYGTQTGTAKVRHMTTIDHTLWMKKSTIILMPHVKEGLAARLGGLLMIELVLYTVYTVISMWSLPYPCYDTVIVGDPLESGMAYFQGLIAKVKV